MKNHLIRDEPCRMTIASTDIPLLKELWEFLSRFKTTEGAETTITLHEDQRPILEDQLSKLRDGDE